MEKESIGKATNREFSFDELSNAPLVIDAIYKSGTVPNLHSEPLHILMPKTGVLGGFRITNRNDDRSLPAYVVVYTSFEELDWPDFLDVE